MKNSSKVISILLYLGGLGLIIASFFLFLKECQQENLFYLNLVATSLVYSIVTLRSFDLLGTVEKVGASGSGYGLKWVGMWIYIPLALLLVVTSIIFGFGFNFSLIGHLVLLFVLLSFFFGGNLVSNNANEVIGAIEARKSGLKEISAQIDMLEMNARLAGGKYQDKINALRESVRYITASDNKTAVMMEDKLLLKIKLLTTQVEDWTVPAEAVNAGFDECMSIIEMRKKQY